jgi:hypothetical protein
VDPLQLDEVRRDARRSFADPLHHARNVTGRRPCGVST